jgi:hypothetical protein
LARLTATDVDRTALTVDAYRGRPVTGETSLPLHVGARVPPPQRAGASTLRGVTAYSAPFLLMVTPDRARLRQQQPCAEGACPHESATNYAAQSSNGGPSLPTVRRTPAAVSRRRPDGTCVPERVDLGERHNPLQNSTHNSAGTSRSTLRRHPRLQRRPLLVNGHRLPPLLVVRPAGRAVPGVGHPHRPGHGRRPLRPCATASSHRRRAARV